MWTHLVIVAIAVVSCQVTQTRKIQGEGNYVVSTQELYTLLGTLLNFKKEASHGNNLGAVHISMGLSEV